MKPYRWIVGVLGVLVGAVAGCQIDEVTVGVGDARTEDAFGDPVVRPFDPDESLQLYRHRIERKKPEQQDEPGEPDDPDAPDDPEPQR